MMHIGKRAIRNGLQVRVLRIIVLLLPVLMMTGGQGPLPVHAAGVKSASTDNLPVYPGAVGFGTMTPAGRGGTVLRVTTLSDSGKGSLREALKAEGPRIVVFEVAGEIRLTKHLYVRNPYVTVAGQTAPSPGITLTGASLAIRTHDVLIQHLRVRVGDGPGGPAPEDRDGIKIQGIPVAKSRVRNVIIDHCSVSWAIDEGISIWYKGISDITISNSIISENLSRSLHPKGEHSKGLIIGDHAKRVSVIGNLFAHNMKRNPFLKGDVSAVVVNNIIYNPGRSAIHFADKERSGPTFASIVGNLIILGSDSHERLQAVELSKTTDRRTTIFLRDTTVRSIKGKESAFTGIEASFDPLTSRPPVWVEGLTAADSRDLTGRVLSRAGARPADRDPVDRRIVREVKTMKGGIIDSPEKAGGLQETDPVRRTLDIPDNPHGDDNGNGYTNVEEWLHSFARDVEGS